MDTLAEKKFIYLGFLLGIFLFAGIIFPAKSETSTRSFENLKYPIVELGNCQNKKQCEVFCDKEENLLACVNFAKTNGLIGQDKAAKAKKIAELGAINGPGGCRSQDQCESYCDDSKHLEECVAFAKDHDLMSQHDLQEAEKVLTALQKGAKMPGNCRSKDQCEAYCEIPNHTEECVAFAEDAGFMSPKEADIVRKTGGNGPGGCRGKEDCESYCEAPSHTEECVIFGLEHDLMPSQEREEAVKLLSALQKGVKMPNCRGKEECDDYCSLPGNALECINFSEAAGFMSSEEAARARKMADQGLTSGPGGCRGKNECEAFCEKPENMVTCVDFAEKSGMMSPEEATRAKKMAELGINGGPGGCRGEDECRAFCEKPENSETCLDFAVKTGMMSSEEAGQAKKGMQMMREGGPGGCRGDECKGYCDNPSHTEECVDFALKHGIMNPEEAERAKEGAKFIGKCKNPEECVAYCQANSSDPVCREMKEKMRPEGLPSDHGEKQFPERKNPFDGKCSSEEECVNYCVQNPRDSVCQAMMSPKDHPSQEMPSSMMPNSQMPLPGVMPPQLEEGPNQQGIQGRIERQIEEQQSKQIPLPVETAPWPNSGQPAPLGQPSAPSRPSLSSLPQFFANQSTAALISILAW